MNNTSTNLDNNSNNNNKGRKNRDKSNSSTGNITLNKVVKTEHYINT